MNADPADDEPDATEPAEDHGDPPARRTRPAMLRLRRPALPGFRVIEMVRDASGRARPCGNIWHPTLEVTRRFARAVAANTQSHRVLVADARGEVLEDVPLPSADERKALWAGSWRELPLPALPPQVPRPEPPPRLVAPRPTTAPDVDLALLDET